MPASAGRGPQKPQAKAEEERPERRAAGAIHDASPEARSAPTPRPWRFAAGDSARGTGADVVIPKAICPSSHRKSRADARTRNIPGSRSPPIRRDIPPGSEHDPLAGGVQKAGDLDLFRARRPARAQSTRDPSGRACLESCHCVAVGPGTWTDTLERERARARRTETLTLTRTRSSTASCPFAWACDGLGLVSVPACPSSSTCSRPFAARAAGSGAGDHSIGTQSY